MRLGDALLSKAWTSLAFESLLITLNCRFLPGGKDFGI